jgi:hypothetical protein
VRLLELKGKVLAIDLQLIVVNLLARRVKYFGLKLLPASCYTLRRLAN